VRVCLLSLTCCTHVNQCWHSAKVHRLH
jgi:hypothetical protein